MVFIITGCGSDRIPKMSSPLFSGDNRNGGPFFISSFGLPSSFLLVEGLLVFFVFSLSAPRPG